MHPSLRFRSVTVCLFKLILFLLVACGAQPAPASEVLLEVAEAEAVPAEASGEELSLQGRPRVIKDEQARRGKAFLFLRNSDELRWRKTLPAGTYTVTLNARGELYKGAPELTLYVGNTTITRAVPNTAYEDIAYGQITVHSGDRVRVRFSNDLWMRGEGDRNVLLSHVRFKAAAPAPNPEQPSPQPSPEQPEPKQSNPELPIPELPTPEPTPNPQPQPEPTPGPGPAPQPSPEPEPAPQRAYYISPQGDDANDGLSPESAWRSLAKASSTPLKDGYALLLERGAVFRETLLIPRGGSLEQPFVIGAYGSGPAPVISGAERLKAWQSEGGGVYSAALQDAPRRVWHGATELIRGSRASLADGQFAHQNGQLFIKVGGRPGAAEASVRPHAVRDALGYDHVTLRNIVAEKSNASSKHDGVILGHPDSDHWVIENVTARHGAANGFFGEQSHDKGIGSALLVKNSESAFNALRGAVASGHAQMNQVFDGFYTHHNHGDGLLINSRDGVLKNSRLEYNGLVTGGAPKHAFYMYPWNGGASGWTVSGNTMRGNRDSGGRIAGTNHHFHSNTVTDNPYGLFVVDNDGPNSGHTIERNAFLNTDPVAYVIELEGAENVSVNDNVFYDAFGVGLVPGKLRANSNVSLRGNLFGGDKETAFVALYADQDKGFKEERNCYDYALKPANLQAGTGAHPFTLLAEPAQTGPQLTSGRRNIILPDCSGTGG